MILSLISYPLTSGRGYKLLGHLSAIGEPQFPATQRREPAEAIVSCLKLQILAQLCNSHLQHRRSRWNRGHGITEVLWEGECFSVQLDDVLGACSIGDVGRFGWYWNED